MQERPSKRLIGPDGQAQPRIVGFEHEYGLGYEGRGGALEVKQISGILRYEAIDRSDCQFMDDGSRIYQDVGSHPEYCTPEETDPEKAAHRMLAGHVIMAKRYRRAAERYSKVAYRDDTLADPDKYSLVANTESSSAASWASHENYLASRSLQPNDYIPALAANNLSRIVWSGAGAVRYSSTGYRFELSEKAAYIEKLADHQTTKQRALVNLRDTPYANAEKYRRIHNITGETIFSPFGNAFRPASASLVLRACELGVKFDDLLPVNPVYAMRQISADPSLRQTVHMPGSCKKRMTGLDIQEAILERSLKAARAAEYITTQEESYGVRGIALVQRLRTDPYDCGKLVDWVVKQELIEKQVHKKQVSNQSAFWLAWACSVGYHTLLPKEGIGMRMVRKGIFEDAPPEAVLDNGLPLPETRATVRAAVLHRLGDELSRGDVAWDGVWNNTTGHTLVLDDPYDTDLSKVEPFVTAVRQSLADRRRG